jgi:hypothetical protein
MIKQGQHGYFCNSNNIMGKLYFIFFFLYLAITVQAQQPPAQLPSLINGEKNNTPGKLTPEAIIKKNIFIKTSLSKPTVFVGEPVLVTYQLYTALSSQGRVSKQPSFNGCSVIELTNEKEEFEEIINGKRFHVFTVRKVQITPLQEGILALGNVTVENIVQLTVNNTVNSYTSNISNQPFSVQVIPLPDNNKPVGFSGLIGNYTIAASVDTNTIPVGENILLHVDISGTGNIGLAHLPEVKWPGHTEHFDATDSQQVNQDNFPVQGIASFDIPFIGTTTGNITIPAIPLCFFDPLTQQYKTTVSNAITIHVTKAISHEEQMQGIVTEEVSNSKYLWIVAAIGITVLTAFILNSRHKQKQQKKIPDTPATPPIQTIKLPANITEQQLMAALRHIKTANNSTAFFTKAKSFLILAMQYVTGDTSTEMSLLVQQLNKHSSTRDFATICTTLYNTCNEQLYAPVNDESVEVDLYDALSKLAAQFVAIKTASTSE